MIRPIVCHGVEYVSVAELARAFGLQPDTVRNRINRRGMTPEAAVDQPLMTKAQAARLGLAVRRARGQSVGLRYGRRS